MNNAFFDAFNASLPEAEKTMGEPWRFNSGTWAALAIESVDAYVQRTKGGRFRGASLVLTVRLAVAQTSGVTHQSVIEARGETMRVLSIGSDGDDAVTLTCGPVGVNPG